MSQESCWWQSANENWALAASRPVADPSSGVGLADTMVADFARPRPPLWSTRQVENEAPLASGPSLDSQNSQGLDMEKLVLDGDLAALRSSKSRTEWTGMVTSSNVWGPTTPTTATLLEAQESGELMEHMDEANFALDGLKPGQPLRVHRASLQSLLSLCGSMQRRRLLRTHGYVLKAVSLTMVSASWARICGIIYSSVFVALVGLDKHTMNIY